ncbi:MAG: hypothetical protein ACERLG_00325 [Sedimentibacter sp.]
MSKINLIILLTVSTAFFAFGCTKLPASQETGVGPAEYEGIINAGEVKKENDSLKEELDNAKTEIEKMEKDYLNLAKNNESVISKLQEAESKLDIVENKNIPEFNTEKTDKNSIAAYLNDSKNLLAENYKEIEIIQSNESRILFSTVGYGDNFHQIFVWEIGQNKPILIDGASFGKEGSWKWLGSKYIILKSGSSNEMKVLDVENKEIVNTFESAQDVYLLPDTTTVLLQKSNSNVYVFHDIITSTEKELDLDYNNKYSSFTADEGKNEITFMGTYTSDSGIEYSVQAKVNIEKMKDEYEIKNMDDIEESGKTDGTDNIEIEENAEPEGNNV